MNMCRDIKDEYSYYVSGSPIHGKGVFAKENIGGNKKSLACIVTSEDFLYSDLGRYVNHSKSPNSKLVGDDSHNFFVLTLKDIESGDEMSIDYDDNPDLFQKSNNLDTDLFAFFELEEIDDERLKYRFIPKLNENINRIKKLLV